MVNELLFDNLLGCLSGHCYDLWMKIGKDLFYKNGLWLIRGKNNKLRLVEIRIWGYCLRDELTDLLMINYN